MVLAPAPEDRPDVAAYPGGEALYRLRHSTAHVLASAVTELFPETKVAGGPPIENGFYYDFARPTPFTPEDLEQIEARMREIVAEDRPFELHRDHARGGAAALRGGGGEVQAALPRPGPRGRPASPTTATARSSTCAAARTWPAPGR